MVGELLDLTVLTIELRKYIIVEKHREYLMKFRIKYLSFVVKIQKATILYLERKDANF